MPTLRGKAEKDRFFAAAPAKLASVLRGAAKAGAKVVREEIEARTPSSEVRDNLRTRTKADADRVSVRIDIKGHWPRSVGVWLEYGTSPHFISVDPSQANGMSAGRVNRLAKEREGNHSLVINGKFVGATVFHPGARPHPAFRPAMDVKAAEAVTAAQRYITSHVTRSGITPASEGDAE